MELSIIVPVYNVEAYLEKCLQSLVAQTLANDRYEIIVVNDGATDGSQQIIQQFCDKYSHVVGYLKENGGLSDARNYGIERAHGKYLAFIDSDDYVAKDMFETMLSKAYEKDFDMVVCDFIEVYENENRICSSQIDHDILTLTDLKKAMCNIYPSAWNKIYKRTLFKDIRYKKGVWFEDVECLYRLLPLVKTIGTVKQPFYYYMQRQGSISKAIDPRIYHCVNNWNGLYDYYMANPNQYDVFKREFEYCYVRYLLATFVKASLKYERQEYQKAVQLAISEVKKHFPHYRRNPYFYRSLKGVYLILFNTLVANILYQLKGRKK